MRWVSRREVHLRVASCDRVATTAKKAAVGEPISGFEGEEEALVIV